MKELIDRIDMFPTPVWRYRYSDFSRYKDQLISYFTQDNIFLNNQKKNDLVTTEGNLHRSDVECIQKLRDAFKSCFEDVMYRMGYSEDIGITSMWATKQSSGGFHHQHIHSNSFLAGVFYLYDSDRVAEGTAFINHNANLYQIAPRTRSGSIPYFKPAHVLPFSPGTFAIFPSWAQHMAQPTQSSCRIIVGCNIMPIGKANNDHYDQYEFPDPDEMKYFTYEENIKNGYRN